MAFIHGYGTEIIMGRIHFFRVNILLCLFAMTVAQFQAPSLIPVTTCGVQVTRTIKSGMIKEYVNQVKALFPNCRDPDEEINTCGKREKVMGYLNLIRDAVNGMEGDISPKNCPPCPEARTVERMDAPVDCSEVYRMGFRESGVYTIFPKSRVNTVKSISVFCDMDTDGGGWTVIQRRSNYSEQADFYRDWETYKKGFGNLSKDFWLDLWLWVGRGNDNIFTLTNQGVYSLRIDLKNSAGEYKYSLHNSFWIGDEWSNYVLHVQNFTGNATNDLQTQDKMMFSTKDRQNDKHGTNDACAKKHHGAWWYPSFGCGLVNLNAMYMPGINNHNSNWWFWWTGFTGLRFSEMKIRHRYPSLNEK